MAKEKRTKICYWHVPYRMETVLLDPEGEPFETHVDETDNSFYVIDEDGERTYLVFG